MSRGRSSLLLALALSGAGCAANKSFASASRFDAGVGPADAVTCVRQNLEKLGYRIGRMNPGEGFIEGTKLQQVVEADVQTVKRGHLITMKAVPNAAGATSVDLSVIGLQDRRTYAGPRTDQVEPTEQGKQDLAAVRQACFPAPN